MDDDEAVRAQIRAFDLGQKSGEYSAAFMFLVVASIYFWHERGWYIGIPILVFAVYCAVKSQKFENQLIDA